jgi:hypothetical protein
LKKEDEKENDHLASLAKSMRIADFPRVGTATELVRRKPLCNIFNQTNRKLRQ